jgi:hypothetical protein
MRWRIFLEHCPTSWKVAGSIPDSFIGIFNWHNPSGRTVAMGSNRPLKEMGKDKVNPLQARLWPSGGVEVWLNSSKTTALEGGEGSIARPGRTLPPRKTRYPLSRRVGGTQSRSGQVWKISPLPGFDPRTVQPVVSRYTVWATLPTKEMSTKNISLEGKTGWCVGLTT